MNVAGSTGGNFPVVKPILFVYSCGAGSGAEQVRVGQARLRRELQQSVEVPPPERRPARFQGAGPISVAERGALPSAPRDPTGEHVPQTRLSPCRIAHGDRRTRLQLFRQHVPHPRRPRRDLFDANEHARTLCDASPHATAAAQAGEARPCGQADGAIALDLARVRRPRPHPPPRTCTASACRATTPSHYDCPTSPRTTSSTQPRSCG